MLVHARGDQSLQGITFRMFHVSYYDTWSCLVDSSTCSGLREHEGPVVVYLGYRIRSRVMRVSKLSAGVLLYHYLVARLVGVFPPCGVLMFVVLDDVAHLSLFDVVPVGYKCYVEQSVPSKH